jgi:hypothetical protein
MRQDELPQTQRPGAEGTSKPLYRIGGISFILVAVLIAYAVVAYFIWPYSPTLRSTEEILVTLQEDLFGGLASLDVSMLVIMVIQILPLVALYVSLRSVSHSYALTALAVGLVAVVLLIAARPLAELVALSGEYARAASGAERTRVLAAADVLLASFEGTNWLVGTALLCVSGFISSVLMLRSPIFGTLIGTVGLVSNIFGFGFAIPVAGPLLLLVSTIASILWNAMVGRALLREVAAGSKADESAGSGTA